MKNVINTTNDKKNLDKIMSIISKDLENFDVDAEKCVYLELIIEELFVNICSYAYEGTGCIRVSYSIGGDPLKMTIQFIDQGKQFNPLLVQKNNVNVPVNEKLNGGLGILLTKEFADNIMYLYKDDANMLSIKLALQEDSNELVGFEI